MRILSGLCGCGGSSVVVRGEHWLGGCVVPWVCCSSPTWCSAHARTHHLLLATHGIVGAALRVSAGKRPSLASHNSPSPPPPWPCLSARGQVGARPVWCSSPLPSPACPCAQWRLARLPARCLASTPMSHLPVSFPLPSSNLSVVTALSRRGGGYSPGGLRWRP
jgi:hypothetical protein